MNVQFSLLLAVEWAIHPGTVAAGKEVYPDIACKSVGQIAACLSLPSRDLDETPETNFYETLKSPDGSWTETCTLPAADKTLCTTVLDYFVNAFRTR
jgi:hypothetical protein